MLFELHQVKTFCKSVVKVSTVLRLRAMPWFGVLINLD